MLAHAEYIPEMLEKSNTRLQESLYMEDPAILGAIEDKHNSGEEEEEYNDELVRESLCTAMDAY